MATPRIATIRPVAPAAPRPAWNTLQLLKGGLYMIWLLDLVLLLSIIGAVQAHRHATKVIGKDTAPSIIAAQHIKAALADMDANAANQLLAKADESSEVEKAYEARRREALSALIDAAQNITYGDKERVPIQTIQLQLGNYETRIQRARDLRERRDPQFLAVYRDAEKIMDNDLLTAADDLDKANRGVLDDVYSSQWGISIAARVGVLFAGLAVLIVLFLVQSFLTRRTRRTFNLGLLCATLVTVILLTHTMGSLISNSHDLKTAKEDAFESIHVLWQARAVAFAAKADESRYLLDTDNGPQYENAFFEKLGRLGKPPQGYTYASLASAFGPHDKIDGFRGYFADEMANITFPRERDAALDMIAKFGDYYKLDGQIRALQNSGKKDNAIAFCVSTKAGGSNWAFDRFDYALGKVLDINQQEFDGSIQNAFADLSGFEWKAPTGAVLIALLTFVGLLARIQEYR